MRLYALAYPELAPADRAWIDAIRAEHDPLHRLVAPHFTLVFPVSRVDRDALVTEVTRQAAGCRPIAFVLRSAVPFKDVTAPGADVFLVPDEGFGALVRLHDRLHASALAPELRLDIPAIPHLTVGRAPDPRACKRLADRLNAREFAVPGTIAALDVVERESGPVRTIARVPLG